MSSSRWEEACMETNTLPAINKGRPNHQSAEKDQITPALVMLITFKDDGPGRLVAHLERDSQRKDEVSEMTNTLH